MPNRSFRSSISHSLSWCCCARISWLRMRWCFSLTLMKSLTQPPEYEMPSGPSDEMEYWRPEL